MSQRRRPRNVSPSALWGRVVGLAGFALTLKSGADLLRSKSTALVRVRSAMVLALLAYVWGLARAGPAEPTALAGLTRRGKSSAAVEVRGTCTPRFRRLRRIFERNLRNSMESSAQLVIYRGGLLAVDLVGVRKVGVGWGRWWQEGGKEGTRDSLTPRSFLSSLFAFAVPVPGT